MEALVTPDFLKQGDKIGIFAPARSVTESELEAFVSLMNQFGFSVVYGENLFGRERQFSGTVEQRLTDFHRMCLDPDIKAIFAARGGYGGAQLLRGIDWELVRDNPKWVLGFSDATALHSAFGKFMKTIHGVMPFSLVMDAPQEGESVDKLIELLNGKQIAYTLASHEYNVSGFAEGAIVGGNLSVLYSLAGTSFEPDYEGKILFLEDLDEYLYHIDRMILNFELRDIFKKISGLVIGDFSDMHDNVISFGRNAYEIIAERALKYNVPTQFGFPAGHKKINLPLIFGEVSTLMVKGRESSLRMY